MVNTLVSPVISKIFTMRGSATTTCRSPPSSRQRLSAPTSTPSAVESRKRHPEEVQDDRRLALGDDAVQALPQLRCRGDVDLPADRDDRRRRYPPAPLCETPDPLRAPAFRGLYPVRAETCVQWRLARAFYSPWTQNLNLQADTQVFPARHRGRDHRHNPGGGPEAELRPARGPRPARGIAFDDEPAAGPGGRDRARTKETRSFRPPAAPTAPIVPRRSRPSSRSSGSRRSRSSSPSTGGTSRWSGSWPSARSSPPPSPGPHGSRWSGLLAAFFALVISTPPHSYGELNHTLRVVTQLAATALAMWISHLRGQRNVQLWTARSETRNERRRRVAAETAQRMQTMARALTTAADPAQVADAVFAALRDELQVDAATFALLERARTAADAAPLRLRPRRTDRTGCSPRSSRTDRCWARTSPSSPSRSRTCGANARTSLRRSQANRFHALAIVPLVVSDHTIGAVVVHWARRPRDLRARPELSLHHHRRGGPGRRAGPPDADRLRQPGAEPTSAPAQLRTGRRHDARRRGPCRHRRRPAGARGAVRRRAGTRRRRAGAVLPGQQRTSRAALARDGARGAAAQRAPASTRGRTVMVTIDGEGDERDQTMAAEIVPRVLARAVPNR